MQYQEQEDLASYLDAMFGYYETECKASVTHDLDKAASVGAPTATVYPKVNSSYFVKSTLSEANYRIHIITLSLRPYLSAFYSLKK